MSFETILPQGAATRLTDGWTYLDVRTSEEFAEGHPPGAYNIPVATMSPAGMVPNDSFLAIVQRHFPADTSFVVGCKAGGRSAMACEIMGEGGYTSLANMDGGYHVATRRDGWPCRGGLGSMRPRTVRHASGRAHLERARGLGFDVEEGQHLSQTLNARRGRPNETKLHASSLGPGSVRILSVPHNQDLLRHQAHAVGEQ